MRKTNLKIEIFYSWILFNMHFNFGNGSVLKVYNFELWSVILNIYQGCVTFKRYCNRPHIFDVDASLGKVTRRCVAVERFVLFLF